MFVWTNIQKEAVYNIDNLSQLYLNSSSIHSNVSGRFGGGIAAHNANLTIYDSNINQNLVASGQPVMLVQGENDLILPIYDCGGGIYAHESTIFLTQSYVNENESAHGGGLCYEYEAVNAEPAEINIYESEINGKELLYDVLPSVNYCAGIYIANADYTSTPLEVNVFDGSISDNTGATIGGGVHTSEVSFRIYCESVIANNTGIANISEADSSQTTGGTFFDANILYAMKNSSLEHRSHAPRFFR